VVWSIALIQFLPVRWGSKLAQVIKTIVVPCSREKAFVVFVEIGHESREHLWGTVIS
jgi:hypothetical protein